MGFLWNNGGYGARHGFAPCVGYEPAHYATRRFAAVRGREAVWAWVDGVGIVGATGRGCENQGIGLSLRGIGPLMSIVVAALAPPHF